MKKIYSILTLATFISFTILFQSCSDEKNPVEPTDEDLVKIPETTKSVDSTDYSSNLINISNDSLTFTFQSGFTTKYNPAVNDILVIANGEGFPESNRHL